MENFEAGKINRTKSECIFAGGKGINVSIVLHALGVPCELRKYGSLDKPEIAHVFHVNCKLEEAKRCNDEECAFFERFIK